MASELLFFFNRNFTTTAPETLENLGFFFSLNAALSAGYVNYDSSSLLAFMIVH